MCREYILKVKTDIRQHFRNSRKLIIETKGQKIEAAVQARKAVF